MNSHLNLKKICLRLKRINQNKLKNLKKLRIAYENDMKKVYGNKPATPPDIPPPKPKPKPEPPPEPTPAPKPKATPKPKAKPVPQTEPPPVPPPEPVKQVGVELIINNDKEFWEKTIINDFEMTM